ncbi:YceI family protein [Candidatus Uhrbacteria bacterium]|nr:YceI family protein [Candidatus Uhrbacteria bacterium]
MFKYLVPTLVIPLIFLGAGCTEVAPDVVDEIQEEVVVVSLELVDGAYALNTEEASVEWSASKKVGAEHFGTINVTTGEVVVEGGVVTGGAVVIDMSTIVSLDLPEDSRGGLQEHLMSADFFNVEAFPVASFTITGGSVLEGIEDANYRLDGSMTIKGESVEMSVPVMLEVEEGEISLAGEMEIDRTKFGITYGSGSFFDNLGDAVINDVFGLTLALEFESGETENLLGEIIEEVTEGDEGEEGEEKGEDDHGEEAEEDME